MSVPRRHPAATYLPSRRHLLIAAMLAAIFALVSIANPAFATATNIRDLLVQSAPVIIVACGMTLVVLTGEIDISVGSLLGTLGALMGVLASTQRLGLPVPAVVLLTLLAGLGVGLFSGVLVTIGRVPSIIATLGMMTILRGITELVMGGSWITDLPAGVRLLGTGTYAGTPLSLWVAAIVVITSLALAHRTRLGLHIYAVGGNPTAAANARIATRGVKLFVFAFIGLLTAVAALVAVPQQSVIESGIGVGFELTVITAVVVGGTSIRGGYGGIIGTLLAALLLGSIRTSLVFLNLGDMATYWERAIQGAFILAAVLVDHLSHADSRSTPAARPTAGAVA